MRNTISIRVFASVIVLAMMVALVPSAFAAGLSVGSRDIDNSDDVRDLREDIEDEIDQEKEDLEDDCALGIRTDLDDEEDEMLDDLDDIYIDAVDDAPSALDDDLRDDQRDLEDDIENEFDDLRDRGCDSFGTFGGGYYRNRVPGVTSVTPLTGSYGRPLCFNGIGTFFPSFIHQVPGYQNFGGTACTGYGFGGYGYGGFGGYNWGGYNNYNTGFGGYTGWTY